MSFKNKEHVRIRKRAKKYQKKETSLLAGPPELLPDETSEEKTYKENINKITKSAGIVVAAVLTAYVATNSDKMTGPDLNPPTPIVETIEQKPPEIEVAKKEVETEIVETPSIEEVKVTEVEQPDWDGSVIPSEDDLSEVTTTSTPTKKVTKRVTRKVATKPRAKVTKRTEVKSEVAPKKKSVVKKAKAVRPKRKSNETAKPYPNVFPYVGYRGHNQLSFPGSVRTRGMFSDDFK